MSDFSFPYIPLDQHERPEHEEEERAYWAQEERYWADERELQQSFFSRIVSRILKGGTNHV